MSIDLEYRTKGWTDRRVILQYGAPDLTRKFERDREEMVAHGYIEANVVAEATLITAVYVNHARPQPPRHLPKPKQIMDAGALKAPLSLRGLRALVVASSDGFESEWHVELVFAPPDKRSAPVSLWLSPEDVGELVNVLREAGLTLARLPEQGRIDGSRLIGKSKGVAVWVRNSPAGRGVRVTARSGTRKDFGPTLTEDDVADWLNELEAAEDEGERLRAHF